MKALATIKMVGETLMMKAVLSGLEPGATGGIHIHEGFGCTASSGALDAYAGGHYYTGLAVDPWSTTYTSNANGVATVELSFDDFSLEGTRPVAGRTIVVHLSSAYSGARAACAVIVPSKAEVAEIAMYPDFSGAYSVGGMMFVHPTTAGTRYEGLLTGLEPSATGGWHVHAGFSCGSSYGPSGHYFDGTDPWLTTSYSSNSLGVAMIDESMSGFSLHRTWPVYGRSVVVHLSAGSGSTRAGCGVIGATASAYPAAVMSFDQYPGYTGAHAVKGVLSVSSVPGVSSVRIHGVLAGLEPSVMGGLHIHEGFSCAAASGDLGSAAGGHFWPGLSTDVWLDVKYATDASGDARDTLIDVRLWIALCFCGLRGQRSRLDVEKAVVTRHTGWTAESHPSLQSPSGQCDVRNAKARKAHDYNPQRASRGR